MDLHLEVQCVKAQKPSKAEFPYNFYFLTKKD